MHVTSLDDVFHLRTNAPDLRKIPGHSDLEKANPIKILRGLIKIDSKPCPAVYP
jgi:hypothetical protein